MGKYSEAVQPFAWILHDPLPDALRYAQVLRMPAAIYLSLSSLGEVPPKIPPIASLHDALATFSHSILAFHPRLMGEDNPERRWLYTTKDARIDPGKLRTLIQNWLVACYGDAYAKHVCAQWTELHWASPEIIDLMTADDHLKRMLLPGLAARWLLDQGYQFTLETAVDSQAFPLRLAPLMTRRYTAELITEPVGEAADHSYVLRFWLERLPSTGEWCLLGKASVRRWQVRPLVNEKGYVSLTYNRGKSVYLRRSAGYLDNQPRKDVFSRLTLKLLDKGIDGLHWLGKQAEVFQQLRIGGSLPAIQEMVSDPFACRDSVLITMENQDSDDDSPATGLQPRDHRRAFDDLTACLEPIATPAPLWTRVSPDRNRNTNSHNMKLMKKIPAAIWREALGLLPPSTCIELHVDDLPTVKRILLNVVGMWEYYQDRLDDNPLVIEANGRQLEIVQGNDPKLTELLRRDEQNGSTWQEIKQARINEITQRYRKPSRNQPRALLIMLRNYSKIGLKRHDPKEAIRYGLINAGCLSQFFTPKGPREKVENYELRIENAIRDLLRVLGYRLNPYYVPPKQSTLPEKLDLIALWLIQLNARRKGEQKLLLPVVVHAPSDDSQLHVLIPKDTGSAQLYPTLREGIIAAAQWSYDYGMEETTSFFRDALQKCLRGSNAALLLVADKNLRRVYPELASQTGNAPLSLNATLEDFPQARVARLRFSREDEAPFCIPEERKSRWQGLYVHPHDPHVFYSLHNMVNRRQGKNWMKLERPDKSAANPSTIQIWVNNLHPEDDPTEWAALVHRLRRESSHTDDPTVYPQPLHDVMTIVQYLSRAVKDEEEDELNAVDSFDEDI